MSKPLDATTIAAISQYDGDKRYQYLLKTVTVNRQIWILTDDDGAVMLNTQDEDCVPVWPNEEFAKAWATGDWQDCRAKSIDLDKWLHDWTPGLLDDDLCVVVFPSSSEGQDEEGLVVFADEFDYELRQKGKARR